MEVLPLRRIARTPDSTVIREFRQPMAGPFMCCYCGQTFETGGAMGEQSEQSIGADLGPDDPVSNATHSVASTAYERQTDPGYFGLAGEKSAAPDRFETEKIRGSAARLPTIPEAWQPDTSRPVDAAWASFGPPPHVAEAIVGPDDRDRVPDPSLHPWRMSASLQILAPDNQIFVGTGWFISPRTLVTAGHCVFIHEQNGRYNDWAKAIRVMPGRNGTSLPYGAVVSTTFHTSVGWARDKDPRYDYAAIVLPTDLGNSVGWFGVGVMEDAELVGSTANISGYPGDKTGAEDGTQWYDARKIRSVDSHQIHYEVDTWGGQSGSAVWIGDGNDRYAVGIHAYGSSYFGNSATRITPSVRDNLIAWR